MSRVDTGARERCGKFLEFNQLDLNRMAERLLAGEELRRAVASAVLNCPDEKLPVSLLLRNRIQ
jgi:hypothetical protein